MWKWYWGSLVGVAVLAVAFYSLASMTQFTLDHPRAKGHKVVVTNAGAVKKDQPGKITGRLIARQPDYDFGVLDPRTMGKHVFVLENLGPGPITLTELGTSCSKCTVA